MSEPKEALQKTKVLDLSDERCIYGVKLLADHGARVLRPESLDGDPLRSRGPLDEQTGQSLWYTYYASSRHLIRLDIDAADVGRQLNQIAAQADICILGTENEFANLLNVEEVRESNPQTVIVQCSPFGSDGPWSVYKAPEIVAAALGGSAGVTGDPDTPPLKLFGELNFNIVGAYTAIAALSALHHAHESGQGQIVEVPAHECIASSLEHVFMWYFYQHASPNARAKALERRGSLHWTNLYEVMKTKNGAMMVTPTPNLDAQLAWLIEEGAFQDLLDPKYEELENRRLYYQRFMEVIREWVAEQDTEELFFKAQERHSPYGWVQNIEQVVNNPQLTARDWWQTLKLGETEVDAPGPAYRLEETPGHIRPVEWVETDGEALTKEIGWD